MQCKATSKAKGKQCGREAIPGGTVCRYHGGAAPQVKRSAALRLAALVDPAIGVLAAALKQRTDRKLAVTVAQDVLNRNGYKSYDEIKIKGAGPEEASEMSANDPRERILGRVAQMADPRTAVGGAPRSDGQ